MQRLSDDANKIEYVGGHTSQCSVMTLLQVCGHAGLCSKARPAQMHV